MSEEEIVDALNTIISAQGAARRNIIWNIRLLKSLEKQEKWLREEQNKLGHINQNGG